MPDRPIIGADAALYLRHVGGHGLLEDTRWLMEVGRFPVGCRVLDVGCGTGTLVTALASETEFDRSVVRVELSQELAEYAGRALDGLNGTVVHVDFLKWTPPSGWRPDTLVMSYFLHHSEDLGPHLHRAAGLLSHGGRLYVVDRVALNQHTLDAFPQFWDEHYRAAHEWYEEIPQLATVSGLIDAARDAGFDFVRREVCPHDRRSGAEGFPKTLMEFWRHEPGRTFPAVLVVSPAHLAVVDEIVLQLASMGLQVIGRHRVAYSDALISTIYERCHWREPLIKFVGEVCSERTAIALLIGGENSVPDITQCQTLLARLSIFKKTYRDRWQNINGPVSANGRRAIILPFHVPEPYEAEAVAEVVGLTARKP